MAPFFFHLIHSQWLITLPLPQTSFVDKTVIVTGGNYGLGREASRHIANSGRVYATPTKDSDGTPWRNKVSMQRRDVAPSGWPIRRVRAAAEEQAWERDCQSRSHWPGNEEEDVHKDIPFPLLMVWRNIGWAPVARPATAKSARMPRHISRLSCGLQSGVTGPPSAGQVTLDGTTNALRNQLLARSPSAAGWRASWLQPVLPRRQEG